MTLQHNQTTTDDVIQTCKDALKIKQFTDDFVFYTFTGLPLHTVDELMTLDDGDHVFVASKGEEHSGSVCLQAYKIGHKLGQGGFGSVYAALDRGTK